MICISLSVFYSASPRESLLILITGPPNGDALLVCRWRALCNHDGAQCQELLEPCDRVASTMESWREEVIHFIIQQYLAASPTDNPDGPLFPRLAYSRTLEVFKHLAECLGFSPED